MCMQTHFPVVHHFITVAHSKQSSTADSAFANPPPHPFGAPSHHHAAVARHPAPPCCPSVPQRHLQQFHQDDLRGPCRDRSTGPQPLGLCPPGSGGYPPGEGPRRQLDHRCFPWPHQQSDSKSRQYGWDHLWRRRRMGGQ